ncbi:MAG: SDR family oxidoreductase [Thermodesulfobacteriota bacterium]
MALVTGAALGLGRSFALTLAEAGADVVIADIDKDHLDETEAILRGTGQRVFKVIADVSNPVDVARMVDESVSNLEHLDIAVNNAGMITRPARLHEMSAEDWNKVISVNLTGVFLCMQREIDAMLKQGNGGTVINLSSVLGLVGLDPHLMPRVNYIASKHGVIGLTRQGALEYAGHGIRVNAIAPSWFSGTSLSRDRNKVQTKEEQDQREMQIISLTPMRRRGQIDELQGLLLFLASDASTYTTGQVFVCDGGWTAH